VPKRATCDWNSQACPRKPIAIPELLDYWAETDQCKGALVTIDAVGCKAAIADKIVERIIGDLLQTEINEKRAGSIQSYRQALQGCRRLPVRGYSDQRHVRHRPCR
jgi:hypothetical protein